MPTANDQLRQARERTESSSHPGECMSRQELAELVNTYVWEHHDMTVEIDANYIGKLERGVICWPGRFYREALRSILGVSTDAVLGFSNPRRKLVKVADMDRKTFLRAAGLGLGTAALAPLVDLLDASQATAVPSRIGATEIEQVRTAAQVFKTWDAEHGGGLARETVLAQLRWSAGLLGSTCPASLQPDLHSAVAYLACVHGFMCFDAYAFDDARNTLRFGVACAETADDWRLRAEILSRLARQDIHTGHPDQGLTWIEHALVRTDRLTETQRATLHTVRGRALAKMNRTQDALRSVGIADEWFARRNPANDPAWLSYYDAAQHAGDTGHALFDLSIRGTTTEAKPRLAEAVASHRNIFARSRVMSQIKLATLDMITGDPHEAVTIGNDGLDAAGTIRSRRVADLLRDLSRSSNQYDRDRRVVQLRQRIASAVLAS